MIVGQVVTATINVTNDGGDFPSLISGTLGGFNLENLTRTNATTYKAQFTVANGGNDYKAGHKIPVDTVVLIDAAGNLSNSFSDSINQPNDPIDANLPNITNVSIPNDTMKVGNVVTATITVDNDGGEALILSSGTIAGFGLTPTSFIKSNDSTYTAQFTVTDGGTDYDVDDNIPVNLVLIDSAGITSNTYNTPVSQNADLLDASLPNINFVSLPNVPMVVNDVVNVNISVDNDGGDFPFLTSGSIGGFNLVS